MDIDVKKCLAILPTMVEEDDNSELSIFDSKEAPYLSIDKYVYHLVKYLDFSPTVMVHFFCMLDRIKDAVPELKFTACRIHRLFLAILTVSYKYMEDEVYYNKAISKVGGIALEELNFLEIAILTVLDWDLYVSDIDYKKYTKKLNEEFFPCVDRLEKLTITIEK